MSNEEMKAKEWALRIEPTMVLVSIGGARIGSCVHTPDWGWKFISNVSSHKNSRKFWPDTNSCIPRWAFDLADEMLTFDEWKKRQSINP